MKIFSLESKISLAVWSLILGLVVTLVLYILSQRVVTAGAGGVPTNCLGAYTNCLLSFTKTDYGWPFHFYDSNLGYSLTPDNTQPINLLNLIYDLAFWILSAFVILFVIKNLKNKNISAKTS